MAYLVLARKWRPKGFDAITGQEHVTRTLKNAITQNRVHHAFLFCGARGVGKTSAARVFARALNCHQSAGPTVDPCGVCAACTEIAAGTSVDVFEIDGASNRGIGEIRELREGVAYAPQRDRHKIYIIDEVHMLTTEAFNALLKTLEEPPAHVKFIFATTEPHKIPVTILSRCQRFDFKRIPAPQMAARLREILEAEGVAIEEAALRVVARESEGSMRDALSLLDRVISFAGMSATLAVVTEVLGVADRAWLHRLVEAGITGEVAGALAVVEEAFDYGLEMKKLASDIVHYWRDVAVVQVAGEKAPTDLSPDEMRVMTELGKRVQAEDVQRLVRLWTETAERLVQASFPRLEVEMAVIRMCRMRPLVPLDALMQRLEGIERRLAAGEGLGAEVSPVPKPLAQAPRLGPPVEVVPVRARAPVAEGVAVPEVAATREVVATPVVAEVAPQVSATAEEQADRAEASGAASVPYSPFSDDDWEAFVDLVRGQAPALAGALDQAHANGIARGTLMLEVAGEVSEKRIVQKLRELEELVRAQRPEVRSVKVTRVERVSDTPQLRRYRRESEAREARRASVEGHALVRALVERFGGQLAGVVIEGSEEDGR